MLFEPSNINLRMPGLQNWLFIVILYPVLNSLVKTEQHLAVI